MAMVINTNVQAIRTHGVYNHNSSAMNEAMTRVATGQKINSAKDNASTWAITQRMRDRMRANDQANQNVQNDSALIRTAQGGIENTVSILTTLKERAINAANDSNINLDRTAIATEVKQLVQQIDDNANKVKFNGRYLLNGAVDETATETPTTNMEETSKVVEPLAAGMPAAKKDGSTTGSHAVYQNVSLAKWNSTTTAAAASDTKLVDLVKSDATASTDTIFKVGDKITFSWNEDGQENSYTYEVTGTSQVKDLAFDVGAVHFYNEKAVSTALVSKDLASETYSVENPAGTFTSYSKQTVFNNTGRDTTTAVASNTTKIKTASDAPSSGLYAVGDYGVKITDFKIGVTYVDSENEVASRTDAQKALRLTGVQQAEEYDPIPKASATAIKVEGVSDNSSGSAAVATTATRLMDIGIGTNKFFTNYQEDDLITLKWGEGEDDSITVNAKTTLGQLQQALQDQGKSLNLSNIIPGASTATTGHELTDADGYKVTQESASLIGNTNVTVSSGTTTTAADLYFVGKTGVRINTSDIEITAAGADGTERSVNYVSSAFSTPYKFKATEETTEEAAEELTIADSNPLTFHIGGEADFAIDVTIDKMTVDNLFAQRDADGNITKIYDDTTFSDLFKTKEGAKEAISIIDTALNTALAEQTKLGAVEARLGYTSDNLTTMNENLEAANSAFRDSDIAKEMTNYMKYSVLSQAAQYMLAQAGQNSYSVLNLLQQ